MKTVKNYDELTELIVRENYYYENSFTDYREMVDEAKSHFKSITSEFDDKRGYYEKFGLEVGEVHIDLSKTEMYYNEETSMTLEVKFYEFYIDSGVPAEDYYYAAYINEL